MKKLSITVATAVIAMTSLALPASATTSSHHVVVGPTHSLVQTVKNVYNTIKSDYHSVVNKTSSVSHSVSTGFNNLSNAYYNHTRYDLEHDTIPWYMGISPVTGPPAKMAHPDWKVEEPPKVVSIFSTYLEFRDAKNFTEDMGGTATQSASKAIYKGLNAEKGEKTESSSHSSSSGPGYSSCVYPVSRCH